MSHERFGHSDVRFATFWPQVIFYNDKNIKQCLKRRLNTGVCFFQVNKTHLEVTNSVKYSMKCRNASRVRVSLCLS